MFRNPAPGFGFVLQTHKIDEKTLEYQMEMALLITDDDERYRKVEELLEQGADPNKKTGQFKWVDTNPLWNICASERFVQLFVSYGADTKERPYIAKSVAGRLATAKTQYDEWKNDGYAAIKLEDDVLKAVKVLLDNGADPSMKWIGVEKILFPATKWNYLRYFKKYGKLPINNAIKYNAMKLVTLLLEYGAKLDEESLRFAKETTEQTGSSEMEELVKKQWKIQSQLH